MSEPEPAVPVREETLEPGLTKQDRRVLGVVPSGAGEAASSTQAIFEAVNRKIMGGRGMLKREVADTLRGLEHLGYINYAKGLYWLARKGAEELAKSKAPAVDVNDDAARAELC
jgi:hypothetical protein